MQKNFKLKKKLLFHSTVNIFQDPRFNSAIDMQTGYKTTLILSMPICNYDGDVIGVAQIINKTNGSNEFTDRDVEVFQRYARNDYRNFVLHVREMENTQLTRNSRL